MEISPDVPCGSSIPGAAYIEAFGTAKLTTWATEVEMFTCAQLAGKDLVCYYGRDLLRYPARGDSKRPTRNALFIANKSGVHGSMEVRVQTGV